MDLDVNFPVKDEVSISDTESFDYYDNDLSVADPGHPNSDLQDEMFGINTDAKSTEGCSGTTPKDLSVIEEPCGTTPKDVSVIQELGGTTPKDVSVIEEPGGTTPKDVSVIQEPG